MAKLTSCPNGHFYDADRFTTCPYCEQPEKQPILRDQPEDTGKTAPLNDAGKTVPVNDLGKTVPLNDAGKTTPLTDKGSTVPLSQLVALTHQDEAARKKLKTALIAACVGCVLLLISTLYFAGQVNHYRQLSQNRLDDYLEAFEQIGKLETEISKLEKEKTKLSKDVSSKAKQINELELRNLNLSFQTDFMDQYIGIVVKNMKDGYYHTYYCPDLVWDTWWGYNIEAAKQNGYKPCPTCH